MKKNYGIGNLYTVSLEKGTEWTQACKVFIMHVFLDYYLIFFQDGFSSHKKCIYYLVFLQIYLIVLIRCVRQKPIKTKT